MYDLVCSPLSCKASHSAKAFQRENMQLELTTKTGQSTSGKVVYKCQSHVILFLLGCLHCFLLVAHNSYWCVSILLHSTQVPYCEHKVYLTVSALYRAMCCRHCRHTMSTYQFDSVQTVRNAWSEYESYSAPSH